VESVEKDCVKVRILQTSACAACKVSGHCNASESKEKIVDVLNIADTSRLHVGDNVVVWASRDVANKALLLGFGMPFLLLIVVLVAVLYLTDNEGVAALAALGSLLPYYFLLWLWRDSIRQQISFHLED
jgi:sigma-E factor negative regulatory protein RseC